MSMKHEMKKQMNRNDLEGRKQFSIMNVMSDETPTHPNVLYKTTVFYPLIDSVLQILKNPL